MTTTQPTEARHANVCPKCNNSVSRMERDILGTTRTCVICGHCAYMDREGRVIDERGKADGETAAGAEDPIEESETVRITDPEREGTSGHPVTDEEETPMTDCSNCHASQNGDQIRFQRLPLRRCHQCGEWEANPEYTGNLGDREEAIGAALQLNFSGLPPKPVTERINRRSGLQKIDGNTLTYWTRKCTRAGAKATQALQPKTGDTWVVDRFDVGEKKQIHHCWAIIDSTTQYILATEIGEKPEPGGDLFQKARRTAEELPRMVVLGSAVPDISPQALEGLPGCETVRDSPERKEPGSSLGKLQRAAQDRCTPGVMTKATVSTIESLLDNVAISINLFEPSRLLVGQTPAEAVGVEPPFRNWKELVVHTGVRSKAGSRREQQHEPQTLEEVNSPTMDETSSAAEAPSAQQREGAGKKKACVLEELRKTLDGIMEKQHSLFLEYARTVQDRRALERTIRILQRRQGEDL